MPTSPEPGVDATEPGVDEVIAVVVVAGAAAVPGAGAGGAAVTGDAGSVVEAPPFCELAQLARSKVNNGPRIRCRYHRPGDCQPLISDAEAPR